jgi:hypothetical protein
VEALLEADPNKKKFIRICLKESFHRDKKEYEKTFSVFLC